MREANDLGLDPYKLFSVSLGHADDRPDRHFDSCCNATSRESAEFTRFEERIYFTGMKSGLKERWWVSLP